MRRYGVAGPSEFRQETRGSQWGDPSSLPQLIFEGVTGSTTYLDISLDAIYIRRGSCSRGEHLSLLLFLSTPIMA